MSGNNRNRQSTQGAISAPSLLGAAVGVVVGLAAVEHAHAQQENRESIVQGILRWVREDVLDIQSTRRQPLAAGAAARRILTRTEISLLPVRVLAETDLSRSTVTDPTAQPACAQREEKSFCVICHDPYQSGDSLMTLPCFHEYHAECIRDYLESTEDPMCPVCRHPVTLS